MRWHTALAASILALGIVLSGCGSGQQGSSSSSKQSQHTGKSSGSKSTGSKQSSSSKKDSGSKSSSSKNSGGSKSSGGKQSGSSKKSSGSKSKSEGKSSSSKKDSGSKSSSSKKSSGSKSSKDSKSSAKSKKKGGHASSSAQKSMPSTRGTTTASGNPTGTNMSAAALFQQKCQVCHGVGGVGASGPKLDAGLMNRFSTQADLQSYIAQNMPFNAPGSLSQAQAAALARYLWSMQKP